VPAEKAGVIKIIAEIDAELPIGEILCTIDTAAAKTPTPAGVAKESSSEKAAAPIAEATPTPATPTTKQESYASGTPSPAAGKIMAENNLAAADMNGTGKDGRITKADALGAVANKAAQPKTKTTPETPSSAATPLANFSRNERKERMSSLRKTISKHLVNAKNSTAMLTTFNEVDLTEVKGVSLGFMGFFMKACATALMEMPAVNAKIVDTNIQYHDYADISIAVSTPKGLVVPKVQNVESLPLHEIEKKVKELALKGRMEACLALYNPPQLSMRLNLLFWECIKYKTVQWQLMERWLFCQ